MPKRKDTTIPFLKDYRKKRRTLDYSKQSTKTQNPSGKGYVECNLCKERIYSFDTAKLYYHILFEHYPEEWLDWKKDEDGVLKCNLCKKTIDVFEKDMDINVFCLRLEDHLFREHRLIDFYTNNLVDETTKVIEFICPSTSCKPKHKYGIGYAWCTEYHYNNNDVKLICPHCLSFMIPKKEWERLK